MSENTTSRYVDRAGTFKCKVKKPVNGWFGESGEKSTPFIRIPAIVTEEGDQEGKEIVYQAWLSDAAFDGNIKRLVEAFPAWDGDLAGLDEGTFTFEGMECEIACESETYEGKARVKAKWLNAVGGGGGKEMDAGKKSSLISRLGSKAKAIAKSTHAENGTQPKALAAVGGDTGDQIPF